VGPSRAGAPAARRRRRVPGLQPPAPAWRPARRPSGPGRAGRAGRSATGQRDHPLYQLERLRRRHAERRQRAATRSVSAGSYGGRLTRTKSLTWGPLNPALRASAPPSTTCPVGVGTPPWRTAAIASARRPAKARTAAITRSPGTPFAAPSIAFSEGSTGGHRATSLPSFLRLPPDPHMCVAPRRACRAPTRRRFSPEECGGRRSNRGGAPARMASRSIPSCRSAIEECGEREYRATALIAAVRALPDASLKQWRRCARGASPHRPGRS